MMKKSRTSISISIAMLISITCMLIGWLIGKRTANPIIVEARPQLQITRITEQIRDNDTVRIIEYGVPTCVRCEKLFEEPEG
jgi:hypothetical protein